MNTRVDSVVERPTTLRPALPTVAERQQPSVPSFDMSDVCIANLGPDLRVIEANGDFLRQLGRTSADVYGQSFVDFVHPSAKQFTLQQLAKLNEGKRDRFSARLVGARSAQPVLSGGLTGIAVRSRTGQVTTIVVLVKPDRAADAPRPAAEKTKLLSELDAKVLEGVAAGISTVQLASKLYLSRQGVEYHVGAMLRQFKSPNRSALVSKAYSQGILSIGHWPPKVIPQYIR
ncbi:LuxR C-terminal-related transcriptional regulator [Amycolatopsis sp. NPDC051128]|uniref:helix-turn-helix transcriptional regulator n=1 Tax=Amycolatopsis sp. NPDC051128 TaxID=3155412 RepID=UPI00341F95EE